MLFVILVSPSVRIRLKKFSSAAFSNGPSRSLGANSASPVRKRASSVSDACSLFPKAEYSSQIFVRSRVRRLPSRASSAFSFECSIHQLRPGDQPVSDSERGVVVDGEIFRICLSTRHS